MLHVNHTTQADIIERLDHKRGCPRLLERGALPADCREAAGGATHYMVIQPVGKHLTKGSGVGKVLHTLQDVLHAVDTLAQLKIVHRCVVVAWVACFFCALHLAESLCALQ